MRAGYLIVACGLALACSAAQARGEHARVDRIVVPEGFAVGIYARGLTRPTAMSWGPDGRLYVAQESGAVVALDPRTRRPRRFATRFRSPLGLAWIGDRLFVSRMGGVDRIQLRRGRAAARRTVVSGLPFGRHQQDNIVVGRDRRLYFGSGSTCDACREEDRRSGAVLSMRPDGGDLRVVARGLRNPFGLAREPSTGRIFVSVNGRDDLGAREPAESVVILKRGAHYGWPGCWPSFRRKRLSGRCRGVTPPVAYLEPHSSANGLVFYDGESYPPAYRGNLFVALWGQYLSRRHGRTVVRIVLREDGRARSVGVFARGFAHPLALLLDSEGALLVADWEQGRIYRIRAVSRDSIDSAGSG